MFSYQKKKEKMDSADLHSQDELLNQVSDMSRWLIELNVFLQGPNSAITDDKINPLNETEFTNVKTQ
jgi:hypothetical protein